jgi:large subunit ribosomal protein L25
MEKTVLQAEPRRAGRHELRELREADRVPAVIYGPAIEPLTIAVDSRELHRALVAAGTGLISLQVGEDNPLQVLPREIQRHPIKRHTLHVDFLAVSMTELLRLEVPVVTEGTAPAMEIPGLVMTRVLDQVEIECLPGDIPSHLTVDLSKLQTIEDTIYVRDLVVPQGIRVLVDPDRVLISLTVAEAMAEEEAAEAEAEEVGEVEVIARGRREEEEAEGE